MMPFASNSSHAAKRPSAERAGGVILFFGALKQLIQKCTYLIAIVACFKLILYLV